MFYREAGQFKSTYQADQQIFPIAQDRIAIGLILAIAFVVVPMMASDYWIKGILIPFLIFSLAALGLNILTGYAGQLSLGSAAFMAVGAFGAYNFMLRIDGMPLLVAFALGGVSAALVGVAFGLPSLRIKGFYLAVATLAAQFFIVWLLTKVGWFSNFSSSGVITTQEMEMFGYAFKSPESKYLLVLSIVVVMALLAKNLKEASALSVDQFHGVVDAVEKAHPAPEAFASVAKGMKAAASTAESTLNSALEKGASVAASVAPASKAKKTR